MFLPLLSSRRFAPLFLCQLCSALNDNLLKNALAMLILFGLGGAFVPRSARGQARLFPEDAVEIVAPRQGG